MVVAVVVEGAAGSEAAQEVDLEDEVDLEANVDMLTAVVGMEVIAVAAAAVVTVVVFMEATLMEDTEVEQAGAVVSEAKKKAVGAAASGALHSFCSSLEIY